MSYVLIFFKYLDISYLKIIPNRYLKQLKERNSLDITQIFLI